MLNLILCASMVSVCLTDGSVMGIQTAKTGLMRMLNSAVSEPGFLALTSLQGAAFSIFCLLAAQWSS